MSLKKLYKNIYFNISLWGGVVIALILSSLIVINNDLDGCLDVSCFSNFLNIFDFPIKAVSAGFILASFVALIHRSEQVWLQIESSKSQNTFKNYLDHKKEFVDFLTLLEVDDGQIEIKNKTYLYKKFFPNNNVQNVRFTSEGESEGEESELYFRINEYNELVVTYNKIVGVHSIPNQQWDNKSIARWLSSYCAFSYKMHIFSKNTLSVNPSWMQILGNSNDTLPEDVDSFIYSCEKIMSGLSSFCFPNVVENKKIENRVCRSNVVNQRIARTYCASNNN